MKTRFILAIAVVILALTASSCVVRQAGGPHGGMMMGGRGPQFEAEDGGYYGQPVRRGHRVTYRESDMDQPPRVASTHGGTRREFEGVLRQKRDANGNPVGEPEFIPAGDSRLNDPLARRRPDSEAVKLDSQGKVTELPGHLDRAAMDKIFDHIESKGGKTPDDLDKGSRRKASSGIEPTHTSPTKLPPSPGSDGSEDEETCPSAAPKSATSEQVFVNT